MTSRVPILTCDPKTDPSQFLTVINVGDHSVHYYDLPLQGHPRIVELSRPHFLDYIGRLAGVSLIVRGSLNSQRQEERSLHIHISGRSKTGVSNAIALIYDTIEGHLDYPESNIDDASTKTEHSSEVHLNIINPPSSFNLRAKVLGREGAYVKHITATTGCKVQLKGLGSQFNDPRTGKEEPVPLYMYITGPTQLQVDEARDLGENLATTVRKEYERFRDNVRPKEGSTLTDFFSWAKNDPGSAQVYVQQMKTLYASLQHSSLLSQQRSQQQQQQSQEPDIDVESAPEIEEVDMDEDMEDDEESVVVSIDAPPIKSSRIDD
ncbi:hypothetical protein GEMRC1_001734 [Eukaryota sp. GEM-RC1]